MTVWVVLYRFEGRDCWHLGSLHTTREGAMKDVTQRTSTPLHPIEAGSSEWSLDGQVALESWCLLAPDEATEGDSDADIG